MADYPWQAPTSAELDVLNQAAAILARRSPGGTSPELAGPMVALFERTAWMGSLDIEWLSRVPCDEVIAMARAVVDAGKIDGSGGGEQ